MTRMDTDFWLGHCQHFSVYAGRERVGRVEDVVYRSRLDRPDVLLVRRRGLSHRLLPVPVDAVECIDLCRDRVVIGDGVTPPARRKQTPAARA
jgi:hypothetical protein